MVWGRNVTCMDDGTGLPDALLMHTEGTNLELLNPLILSSVGNNDLT